MFTWYSSPTRPKPSSRQSGFTLIEILIVMVILGILSTLGIGSFQSSQLKSRDARRKSDLKQISIALEAYYNDYGQYPLSSGNNQIIGCASGECDWGTTFTDANGTMYMAEIPNDPKPTLHYYYLSTTGTEYQLYARLENNLDPSVPTSAGNAPQVYSGLSCGTYNCNYGIASANTTPAAGQSLVDE